MSKSTTVTDGGRRVVLHVGYPKTATTALQRQVLLPWHQRGLIDYLGVFQTQTLPFDFAGLSDCLRETMYLPDDESALRGAKRCNQWLCAMASRDAGRRPIVISSEHFTMSGYSTQWDGVAIWPARSAQRLRWVLDGFDVQVVAVLRDHAELAEAYFLQHKATPAHANADRYPSLQRFIEDVQNGNNYHSSMFRLADVLEAYAQAFGRSNVHAFAFPTVSRDMEAFVAAFWRLTAASEDDYLPASLSRINARLRTSGGYRAASVGLGAYLAALARRSPRLTAGLRRAPGLQRIYALLERIRISEGAEVEALTPAQTASLRQAFAEDRGLLRERWGVRL